MLRSRAKQLHAPIMSAGFAVGGSVLDHRFGKGDAYTLGVEEEYMLLDPDGFDLVQHVEAILADMSGNELKHRVTRELMQSVLEIATPVCRNAAEVERELPRSAGTWPRRLRNAACRSGRPGRIRSACSRPS
jgi:Glutamate-cysteine ligase family 2(GCS2)